MTKFTDAYEYGIRDLGLLALNRALKNKNIPKKDLDGLFVGNMSSQAFTDQGLIGSLIAAEMGLNIPVATINMADASGAAAIRQAFLAIKSGVHDMVAVIGVEKVTDMLGFAKVQGVQALNALDSRFEGQQGLTLAASYALMAKEHMMNHGTTSEQLAMVAVKNHLNAMNNPFAQFQNPIKVDTVLRSKIVADPLHLFDLSAAGDGAAAIILANEKVARDITDEFIYIKGSGQGNAPFRIMDRPSLDELESVKIAARNAYSMAAIEPKQVQLAEVHDSATISEILSIEALGFFRKGDGGIATEEGRTKREGEIPINTSGGLKARGAPFGAVGVAQAVEMYEQLLGIAEKRQVADAEIGVTENHAGNGSTAIVHVYSR